VAIRANVSGRRGCVLVRLGRPTLRVRHCSLVAIRAES
jgi:hypothetical protein